MINHANLFLSQPTKANMIQHLTMEDTAEFLECAVIEQTIDLGHSVVHVGNVGTSDKPCRFVLVNDMFGKTMLSM